jgi:hypothetical protein
VMEASVLGAAPDTSLRLPVYEKNGFGTGVAFVNLNPAPATVTITLRGSNGVAASSVTVPLNPSQ